MPQVVVVGAGFHGLIAAKTYLQIIGAYSRRDKDESENDVLIVDSASDIGGTWARERLYPNLLSQNSYGQYEFSDLPLTAAVPDHCSNEEDQFIPGWKINRYLHVWCRKWDLTRRIRLNWKVERITRLPSKQWALNIVARSGTTSTPVRLTCDKLILATGLTSEPNVPEIHVTGDNSVPAIHSRDIGQYCRENLGYQPIPSPQKHRKVAAQHYSFPRSVAIYGGAKSAFDFVQLFGSLHRSESLKLDARPVTPVQVHWIIRDDGHGPAWMTQPTTRLGTKQLPSDQAGCTRVVGILVRCVHEVPKRIVWRSSSTPGSWIPRMEGSWIRRLLHGNPVGRFLIGQMWKQVDASVQASAKYDSQPKMEKLRPAASTIECTVPGGIANHADLWETIRGPNVHIYRSCITGISGGPPDPGVDLADGTHIPALDLIIHATGWKLSIPIPFDPPNLCATLGLPYPEAFPEAYDWTPLEQKVESKMRHIFHPETFKNPNPPTPNAHRLFRRIAAPSLIAEGDRSFAVIGAVYTANATVVAEVQALWVAAFLTGGLDRDDPNGPLADPERVYEAVAKEVVWARLTATGLSVDTFKYNDTLMNDLGLNPYRMGGRWWRELLAVYRPSSYAGIVEEWMALRGCGEDKQ
ncbi:hypothetical protein BJX61DRAFT_548963 [Aspergillus egyptiacus]|nr:hypothetical protein BJX61DRAFT_548963 [Aspergillus egyptiacus]